MVLFEGRMEKISYGLVLEVLGYAMHVEEFCLQIEKEKTVHDASYPY
jgi:hypothetical protein